MGDGWLPGFNSVEEAKPELERLASYVELQGRKWDDIGIEVRIRYGEGDLDSLAEQMNAWKGLGITHLSLNTMKSELKDPDAHLKALERFSELLAA
jgi:hypothetical protein